MKDPTYYDNEGYYESLGPGDQDNFESLYEEKGKKVDEERARESYRRSFEDGPEAEYHLFRDIVNAFSSGKAGFEAILVNPLYEFGEARAEVLLAKPQSNSVHLCFVSCEVGGHDYMEWTEHINKTHNITNDEKALQSLKTHIKCSSLKIGTIQFITVVRDIDLPDADVNILKSGTNPEYYAIWELIRSAEYNELKGEMEEAKTIKYYDGDMAVPDFRNICQQGIDPMAAENDDIKYSLQSHPVFPLGEVCLALYLDKLGADDNPKEFYRSQFQQSYLDSIHFGNNRGAMDPIAESKVDELIEFGLNIGVFKNDSDTVDEREFKIMWGSEDAGDIKPMVKRKYIGSKVPEEKGQIAFTLAKEDFEPEEHTFDDF